MSFTPRTPVNENPDRVTYRRSFVTRHQVTGWRFAMRRIASGLALHDTRMLTDPLRTQSRSVMMGALIVITGLIGCFIFSLIRPNGAVGEHSVLADRDSSALYVRVDDQLHPVLNLTSARLIVGKAVQPTAAGTSGLDKLPRGAMVGIPGAPERMVQNSSRDADWTVCDSTSTVNPGLTVIAGPLDSGPERASTLPADRAVLVTAGSPETPATWLLWGGRRSLIDLGDRAVTSALGWGSAVGVPRPIAPGLFNAIPEGMPLRVPAIPEAGAQPQFTLSIPVPVGGVVSAYGTDNSMLYYAVMSDGLQPVSPVLATLLRNVNSYGLEQPPRLGADEIARSPVSRTLDTAAFPAQRVEIVDAASSPVTCVRWDRPADASGSSLTLLSGAALPIGDGVRPVDLPGTTDGVSAARVVMPTGTGYFVQTVGQEPSAPVAGSVFWLSDIGMRYGIEADNDDELARTVAALGLDSPALPAPWSVLTLFATGPALSRADALIAYRGVESR